MSHEKQNVIAFLKEKDSLSPYEQFNKAFNFYRNHPRKSRSLELSYNRLGYSEQNLKNIIYDLHKMFDISEVEVHNTQVVTLIKSDFQENDTTKLFIIAFGEMSDVAKELAFQLFKVAQVYGEEILAVPSIKDYFDKINQELVGLICSNDLFLEINDSALDSLANHFKNEIESIEISEEVRVLIDAITPDTFAPVNTAKNDFLNDLSEKAAAVISSVTGEDAKVIKLEDFQNVREEFPFLNEDDCPDVMLIIVGKRITAFKKYQSLHAKLQEVNEGKLPETTEDQKLQLTKDCEAAFAENRLCWEELKYYDTNKTFLGKHPVFFESNIKNEVDLMTNEELINFKNSSVKYFTDQRKQLLKHAGNKEKLDIVHKRISDREFKLSLVNAKLGVSQDAKK